MEDNKIIDLLFQRSEEGLKAIEKKYEKLLYTISINILNNKEDVSEVLNDTYLGIWKSIPPERPNPLISYICKIARNLSLKKYRYKKAEKRNNSFDLSMDELEDIISDEDLESNISDIELGKAINDFLGTLDEENRVIFLRRYWFYDDIKIIAKNHKTSENNIYVKLSRIRKNLRTYLEKEGIEIWKKIKSIL